MQVMTHSASSAVTVNGGLRVMSNTVLQYWLTLLFCSACIDSHEGVAGSLSLAGLQISCSASIRAARVRKSRHCLISQPTAESFSRHTGYVWVTITSWLAVSPVRLGWSCIRSLFLGLVTMFSSCWSSRCAFVLFLTANGPILFENVPAHIQQ